MRRIWVAAVLLSGCSLFDTLDVTYESGVTDSGDVGNTDFADVLIDVAPDVQVLNDVGDSGVDLVGDASPDLQDAGTCVLEFPRTDVPTGSACPSRPPITQSASCDVVGQNGCPMGSQCAVTFNGTGLTTNCLPYDDPCEFIAHGQTCIVKENETVRQLGVCYPGGSCKALKTGQNSNPCVGYCELASGLGCEANEFCVVIDPNLSSMGFGRCDTACL